MSSVDKPRILFAANLYPEHNFMMQRYESIVAALRRYSTAFIDIFDFFGDHERAMELERVCFDGERLRSYFDHADIIELNRRFLEHVLSLEWDILCLCTISHYAYFLLPDTIRKLSKEGRLVVGFFGDDEHMFHMHKYWLRLFDAVVAYSEQEVQRYRQWNPYTYLLPIGVGQPPNVPAAQEKDIDVIFVGRPYGARPQLIRAIKRAGINIQVFGSKGWLGYPDLEDVYQGFLERDAFWSQLTRAKVVLNLTEHIAGKPHINAKVFEAAMAGVFSLATFYPPFEATYGLEDGKSIAFYRDSHDLVGKLEHYLTDDEHRERVAHEMRNHLFAHFAYQNLYEELFIKLEAQWREGVSQNLFRLPVDASHASVIQFVGSDCDYQQAQQVWSACPEADVVYVADSRFSHPNVQSIGRLLQQLKRDPSEIGRDWVVLSTPQAVYDPTTFGLVRHYGEAGLFQDGVYCNSVVRGRRLHKSTHLIDLGSSIWRRCAFLQHASLILRWYRFVGAAIPRRLVKFNLSLMPIFLNTALGAHTPTITQLERYRRITDVARKLRRRSS